MANDNRTSNDKKEEDILVKPIPLDEREHWFGPAVVFAGLEFSIPVLMVGGSLIGTYGFKGMLAVALFTFLVITWIGNSIGCYMGAKTGLSSSIIARQSFGDQQAKVVVAMVIGVLSMGWWAITTATSGNALCAILGIDYTTNKLAWTLVTAVVGIVFAVPSIFGFNAMKWTDYVAVPGGLLLCLVGVYLALQNFTWGEIINLQGNNSMSFAAGVTMVLGLNVSQMVLSADYSRHGKPKVLDNILMPLGIIVVGVPLIIIGGIMGAGSGTSDIVAVMENLGFPIWGFLVLWLASWSSQLINNYSMGLAFSNILNVKTDDGRIKVTLIGTVLSIIIALLGALDHFQDFLNLASLCYPAIAAIMFCDFFVRGYKKWEDKKGWNFMATVALVTGILVGYITAYVKPIGIPPIQSLLVTAIVYYIAMKIKSNIAPDHFTEGFE